jgi:hypothetical protein
VAQVAFVLDGVLLASDPTSPYSVAWDTTQVANGLHTLSATAVDPTGQTASASLSVTVQNAASPTTAFTLTASPAVVSPGGSLTVRWTAPPTEVSSTDWLGLYQVGSPNTSYLWWTYLTGTTAAGQSQLSPPPPVGSLTLPAPATPGTYEVRYFRKQSYTHLVATSEPVTVQ